MRAAIVLALGLALLSGCAHKRKSGRAPSAPPAPTHSPPVNTRPAEAARSTPVPPASSARERRQRVPIHRDGRRQLVRASLPRPRRRQWRNLRHGEDDGGAPHPAVRHLGTRRQPVNNERPSRCALPTAVPFVDGRIIDLSHAAAREIELIGPGHRTVRVEVTSMPATANRGTVRGSGRAPSATVPTRSGVPAWRRATARPSWCCGRGIPRSGVSWWVRRRPKTGADELRRENSPRFW